jgi:hypothetical protein
MIDLNQVNVIDNFLPKQYEDYLYNQYTINSKWVLDGLDNNTSYRDASDLYSLIDPTNKILNHIHEGFQFQNITLSGINNSFFPDNSSPIFLLHYLQILLNYQFNIKPFRIKTNLQTPLGSSQQNLPNMPHIDADIMENNFYTLIYYVNDSDGDTLIFKERFKGIPIKEFNLYKKITPKKGTIVMFPLTTFHSGSHPMNSKARIVINYNFQLIPL